MCIFPKSGQKFSNAIRHIASFLVSTCVLFPQVHPLWWRYLKLCCCEDHAYILGEFVPSLLYNVFKVMWIPLQSLLARHCDTVYSLSRQEAVVGEAYTELKNLRLTCATCLDAVSNKQITPTSWGFSIFVTKLWRPKNVS